MKQIKHLIILFLFAFLFDSCELLKGNDDRMQGVWRIIPYDHKIIVKTEKKTIAYYNYFD